MYHMKKLVVSDSTKTRLIALAVFIGALWVIQILNWITGYSLNTTFGLIPRYISGLDGILGMPLLHNSFEHLIANTPPLLLMGITLAVTATRSLVAVNVFIVLLGGVLVWLLGAEAIHIGASGLVFGWFGFLVTRGFIDRSFVTLASTALIGFVYASILWGVLPNQEGVSWEAHLFGAIAGVAAAFVVRKRV